MGQCASECKPCCAVEHINTRLIEHTDLHEEEAEHSEPTLLTGVPLEGPKAEKQHAIPLKAPKGVPMKAPKVDNRDVERQAREQKQLEEERLIREAQRWHRRAGGALHRKAADALRQVEEAAEAHEEKEEQAARAAVEAFLNARGFRNMQTPRRASCGAASFALHTAVEENNLQVVRAMLRQGADKEQKNSAKKTPVEIAEKCNRSGSHDSILALLQAAA